VWERSIPCGEEVPRTGWGRRAAAKRGPRIWVARGRLCPGFRGPYGEESNRDSTPPTSSAPLYRLNNWKSIVGGTGEPRILSWLDAWGRGLVVHSTIDRSPSFSTYFNRGGGSAGRKKGPKQMPYTYLSGKGKR
jgi:hypothetical protein